MTTICLRALWSHWLRNPLQLFAFLAGLALATALWAGVQAINAEARASYDTAADSLGQGQFDLLLPRDGAAITLDDYITLRRQGWLVSPIVEGQLGNIRLLGIDPLTRPGGPIIPDQSQAQTPTVNGLRVHPKTMEALAQGLERDIAIAHDPDLVPGLAIGDIGLVQDILQAQEITRLIIDPDQPLARPLLRDIAPHLRQQRSTQSADISELTDSFHLNLTAFGLLSFAVGLFIVHSTIGLAFEQRRGTIRTLRSLGVPLRLLITVICLEMVLLALLGATIGIFLGYVIAAVLLPDVAATLKGLYGANISGDLQLRASWWGSGLALALLGTAMALSSRVWQIARMPLLASVKPRAWAVATSERFKWTNRAAFMLIIASPVALSIGGLLAGFIALGCMLIGAALLLPALTAIVLSALQKRAKQPIPSWFWADTSQQLPGLSLALMALLLAVAANIGVSTMVSSFRLTFTGFLDQRLAPELFVQVDSRAQSEQLRAFLQDAQLETLPLRSTDSQIAGHQAELFGIKVGPTYRENWVFLDAQPAAWDHVATGQAVLLNEQLARRANLWVGHDVEVVPGQVMPVAGIVGDYGNPQGQVIMSEEVFEQHFPDLYPNRFGIRTHDISGLRGGLNALGIDDSALIDQASIKALSLQVFERTFLVTGSLNILTLGVAGFAILMSLLTLADLRVPQLAPLWALGLTRRHLGQLELLRATALAALVFLFAIPLGLFLAWVLLNIINVEAFGWRLPMFLFPLDYARLGLFAVLAAGLAACWPALRLMRLPPSALLRVFANER